MRLQIRRELCKLLLSMGSRAVASERGAAAAHKGRSPSYNNNTFATCTTLIIMTTTINFVYVAPLPPDHHAVDTSDMKLKLWFTKEHLAKSNVYRKSPLRRVELLLVPVGVGGGEEEEEQVGEQGRSHKVGGNACGSVCCIHNVHVKRNGNFKVSWVYQTRWC